jgi:hypothetical protein
MLRPARFALLSLGLLASVTALGADRRGKPAEYQASELTEAERAAARERARNRMNAWGADEPAPEFKFPWMMVGFSVLALGIAAPFAYGAYQRQAKELREADAFAQPAGRKRKAADVEEEA